MELIQHCLRAALACTIPVFSYEVPKDITFRGTHIAMSIRLVYCRTSHVENH